MKLKTLVAMSVSTLFATSFVYAAPMDDTSTMQATTPSTQQENVGAFPGANNAANPADMGVPGPMASNNPETQQIPPADMGNSNDEMSADTATGDDDY